MKNPFEGIKIKPEVDLTKSGDEQQQKMAMRDAIYSKYDPMVNEILDLLIAAHRQGIWEKRYEGNVLPMVEEMWRPVLFRDRHGVAWALWPCWGCGTGRARTTPAA